MKKITHKLMLLCAFLAFGLIAAAHTSTANAAAAEDVKVQVNDSLVSFPDARPFTASSGYMLVPVRFLVEKLGYTVDWSMQGAIVKVTISNKQRIIQMETDKNEALVNGQTVKMNTAPQCLQERFYVPLRFVTETFGYQLQWDDQNKIAIVDADGKYHAPAWYAPKPKSVSVLQTAYQYLGTPYVYGGTTPGGFDCSGYVGYVYKKVGIDLPRTSGEMYQTAGSAVGQPQQGDLVFFSSGGTISHVGIYVGNEQFISATSHGIAVADLHGDYWGDRYIGAKRVAE